MVESLLGRETSRSVAGNRRSRPLSPSRRGRTKARCSKATLGPRSGRPLGEERQVGGTPSCLSLNGARDRIDGRSRSLAFRRSFGEGTGLARRPSSGYNRSQTHNGMPLSGAGGRPTPILEGKVAQLPPPLMARQASVAGAGLCAAFGLRVFYHSLGRQPLIGRPAADRDLGRPRMLREVNYGYHRKNGDRRQ